MSTVGQLVDRVRREYVAAPDDAPTFALLSGSLNNSATTFTYNDDPLGVEEEPGIAPGAILEIDRELILVKTADNTTDTVGSCIRGYAGTTATTHAADAPIYVNPTYTRQAIFDAIADTVVGLYPTLWKRTHAEITSASTPVEVPATVGSIVSAHWVSGTTAATADVQLLDPYIPSTTDKAVLLPGVPSGKTVYVVYRTKFTRPTAEADDLAALGVEAEWERIIVVGAAAQVLAGRELDSSTAEFVSEQLRAQGYPVGSASRQRNALLEFYRFLLDGAANRLAAEQEVPVTVSSPIPTYW